MKVIVSDLPVKSEDCIFAEYIGMTSKYKCMFQSGMYSRCNLDCGKECPYLKKGAKEPSISAEEEIGEKNEKLEEFIKRTGIELLPFQKEILSQMTDENKIYICYPPHVGRINTLLLMRALGATLEKGEDDAEVRI